MNEQKNTQEVCAHHPELCRDFTDPMALQRQLRKNLKSHFDPVKTSLTFPRLEGGEFKLTLADPNLLMAQVLESNTELNEIYSSIAATHGTGQQHPWNMIIGFDEFTPGDGFKPLNFKKCMVVSFNFDHLERRLLSAASTWFTPLVMRHHELSRIEGGFARVFRDYLRLHLLGPRGASNAGVPVKLGGIDRLIFVNLRYLLADGDGWRIALDWRGASCIKPCHYSLLRR